MGKTEVPPSFGNSMTGSGVDWGIETEEEKRRRLLREIEAAKASIAPPAPPPPVVDTDQGYGPYSTPNNLVSDPGPNYGPAPADPNRAYYYPSLATPDAFRERDTQWQAANPTPQQKDFLGVAGATRSALGLVGLDGILDWNSNKGTAGPSTESLLPGGENAVPPSAFIDPTYGAPPTQQGNAIAANRISREANPQLYQPLPADPKSRESQISAQMADQGSIMERTDDPRIVADPYLSQRLINRQTGMLAGNIGGAAQAAGIVGQSVVKSVANVIGTDPSTPFFRALEQSGADINAINKGMSSLSDQSRDINANPDYKPQDTLSAWLESNGIGANIQNKDVAGSWIGQFLQAADKQTSKYMLLNETGATLGNMLVLAALTGGLGEIPALARIGNLAMKPVGVFGKIATGFLEKYGLTTTARILGIVGATTEKFVINNLVSKMSEALMEAVQTINDTKEKTGDNDKAAAAGWQTFSQGVAGTLALDAGDALVTEYVIPGLLGRALNMAPPAVRNSFLSAKANKMLEAAGNFAVAYVKEGWEEGIQQAFQSTPGASFLANMYRGIINPENDSEIATAQRAGRGLTMLLGIGSMARGAAADVQSTISGFQAVKSEDRRLFFGAYTDAGVSFINAKAESEIKALGPTATPQQIDEVRGAQKELIRELLDVSKAVQGTFNIGGQDVTGYSNDPSLSNKTGVMGTLQFAHEVELLQNHAKVLEAMGPIVTQDAQGNPSYQLFSQTLEEKVATNAQQRVAGNTTEVSGLYGEAQTASAPNGNVVGASGNVSKILLERIANRAYTNDALAIVNDSMRVIDEQFKRAEAFREGAPIPRPAQHVLDLYDKLVEAKIARGEGSMGIQGFGGASIAVDNQLGWQTGNLTGINLFRIVAQYTPDVVSELYSQAQTTLTIEEYKTKLISDELVQTMVHEAGHLLGFEDEGSKYDDVILAFMKANNIENFVKFNEVSAYVQSLQANQEFLEDMGAVASAEGNATRSRLTNYGVRQSQGASGTSATGGMAQGTGEGFYTARGNARIDTSGIRARSASSGQPLSGRSSSTGMERAADGSGGDGNQQSATTAGSSTATGTTSTSGTGGNLSDDESRAVANIRSAGRSNAATGPESQQGAGTAAGGGNVSQRENANGGGSTDANDVGGDSTSSLLSVGGNVPDADLGGSARDTESALLARYERSANASVVRAVAQQIRARGGSNKRGGPATPAVTSLAPLGTDAAVGTGPSGRVGPLLADSTQYARAARFMPKDSSSSVPQLQNTWAADAQGNPAGSLDYFKSGTPVKGTKSFIATDSALFADNAALQSSTAVGQLGTKSNQLGQQLVDTIARAPWTPKWLNAMSNAANSLRDMYQYQGWMPKNATGASAAWAPDPSTQQGKDLIALQKFRLQEAFNDVFNYDNTQGGPSSLRPQAAKHRFFVLYERASRLEADYQSQGQAVPDLVTDIIDRFQDIQGTIQATISNWDMNWTPALWHDSMREMDAVGFAGLLGKDPMGLNSRYPHDNIIPYMMLSTGAQGAEFPSAMFSDALLGKLSAGGIITPQVANRSDTNTGFLGIHPFNYYLAARMISDPRKAITDMVNARPNSLHIETDLISDANAPEIWAHAMIGLLTHELLHPVGFAHGTDSTAGDAERLYNRIVLKMTVASFRQAQPIVRSLAALYREMSNDPSFIKTLSAYTNTFAEASKEFSISKTGVRYTNMYGVQVVGAGENLEILKILWHASAGQIAREIPYKALHEVGRNSSMGSLGSAGLPQGLLTQADFNTPMYRTRPRTATLTIPTQVSKPVVVPASHATLVSGLSAMRARSNYSLVPAGGRRDKPITLTSDDLWGMDLAMRDIFGAPTKQTIGSMALDRVNGSAVPTTGYPPNTIRRAVQDAINAAEKAGRLPVATDFMGIPGAPDPESFTSAAGLASDHGTMHPNIYQHLVELATYGQDAKTWYLDYAQFWTDWLAGTHNRASSYSPAQRTAMFIELLAFMGRAGQQTEPVENVRITSQIMEMRGNLEMREGKKPGTTAFDDLVESWRLAQEESDTFNSAAEAIYADLKGNSDLIADLKKLGIGLKDKNTGLELQSSIRGLIYKRAEQIPNFRLTGKKGKEKVPYVHTWHDTDWKYWFDNIQASDYTAMAGGNARIEKLIQDVQNIEANGTAVTASLFSSYSNDLKSGKGATVGQAATEQMKSMLNFWLYSTDEISANMKLANYAAAFRDSIENIITIFSVPDVWIFRSIGIPNPNGQGTASDTAVSEFVSALFADIASRMRVHPLQLQAMVWTGFRRRLVEGRELLQPSKDRKSFKSNNAIAIKQADGSEYIVDGVSMSDTQSAGDLDKVMRDPEVLEVMRALANQQFKNPEHVPVKAQLAPVVLPRMAAQREFANQQRMELTFPGTTDKKTGELRTPISERNTRDSGNYSVEVQSPRIFIPISSEEEWNKLDINEFMQTPLLKQESNAYVAGKKPGALTDEQRATAMDTGREGFGETINGAQPVRGMGGAGKTWMPHVIIRGDDFIEVLVPGVSYAHAQVIGSVLAHKIGSDKQAIVLNPTVRNGAEPNALVISAPTKTTPIKWGDMIDRFADVGAQKVVISGGERIIMVPRIGQSLSELATQMIDEVGVNPSLLTVTRADMAIANANPDLSLDISENQDSLPQLVMDSFGSKQGAPVIPKWQEMSVADRKAIAEAENKMMAELYAKDPNAKTDLDRLRAPKIARLEQEKAKVAAQKAANDAAKELKKIEAAARKAAKEAGPKVEGLPKARATKTRARSAISDAVQKQSQSDWASTKDGQWVRDYGYGFWGRVIRRVNADSLPADSDHLFRMAAGTRPTIMNASGHFSNNTYASSEDAIAAADRVIRSFIETEARMRQRTGLTDPDEAQAHIDSEVAREQQSGDYQPPVDADTWVSVADEMDQWGWNRRDRFPPSIDRMDVRSRARSGMQRNTEGTTRQGTYITDPNTGKEILDESQTISMSMPASIGSVIGAHTGLRVSYDPSTRPEWQKDVAASQRDFLINALDAVANANGTLSIPTITQIAGPHEIVTNRVGTWEGQPEFNIRVLFPTNADPALIKVAAAFLGRVAHQDAQGLFRPNSVINATDFTNRVGSNSDNTSYNVVGVEIPASIVGNESDRAIQAVKQLAGAAGVGVDLDASGRNIYVVNYDPPTDADGNTDVAQLAAWAANTAIDIADAFKADGVTTNDVFVGSADTNLVPSNWSEDDPYETYGTIIRDYEAGGVATAQGPDSAGQGAGGTGAINSQGVAKLPVADYEQRAIEWNLDKGQIEIAGDGTRAEQIARVQQKAEEILGPNAQRPRARSAGPITSASRRKATQSAATGPIAPKYIFDPATGKMKVARTARAETRQLLDNSIYASNVFGKTAIREAYQNARDAIRDAIVMGPDTGNLTAPKDYVFDSIIVSPDQVEETSDYHKTGFTVYHDNGKGMSMDDVATAFVVIGASAKFSKNASGGFGIGAGAILSTARYFEMISTFIPESGPNKGIPQRVRFAGTAEDWMSDDGVDIESLPTYTNSKQTFTKKRMMVATGVSGETDMDDVDVPSGWEIDDPSLPQMYIPHPDPIVEIAIQRMVTERILKHRKAITTVMMGSHYGLDVPGISPSWVHQARSPQDVESMQNMPLGYWASEAFHDADHDVRVEAALANGNTPPDQDELSYVIPNTEEDSLWADHKPARQMELMSPIWGGKTRLEEMKDPALVDLRGGTSVIVERPADFYDVVGYIPGLEFVNVRDDRWEDDGSTFGKPVPTNGLMVPLLWIAYQELKANPDALVKYIGDRASTGSRAASNPSKTGTTLTVWPKSYSKDKYRASPLERAAYSWGDTDLTLSNGFHATARRILETFRPTIALSGQSQHNGQPELVNESQTNLFLLPSQLEEIEGLTTDYYDFSVGPNINNEFSWSLLDNPDEFLLENKPPTVRNSLTGRDVMLPALATDIVSGLARFPSSSLSRQPGQIATLNNKRRLQSRVYADQFVAESLIGDIATPTAFIGRGMNSGPRAMSGRSLPGPAPVAEARLTASQELAVESKVIVLSNGAFQFEFRQQGLQGEALPKYLVLDIKTRPNTQAKDANYPFVASRDAFKDHTTKWWNEFVLKELLDKLAAIDTLATLKIFDDAPKIGSTEYKILDAGGILDAAMVQELQTSQPFENITVVAGDAYDHLVRDIVSRNPNAPSELTNAVFFGITFGNHIGVNYNVSSVANINNPAIAAMRFNPQSVVGRGNSILFNPFVALFEEARKGYTDSRPATDKINGAFYDINQARMNDGAFARRGHAGDVEASLDTLKQRYWQTYDLLEAFAVAMYQVPIHEITHQIAKHHNAEFAGRQLHVQGMLSRNWSSVPLDRILPALFEGDNADTMLWLLDYAARHEQMLTERQDTSKIQKFTGNLEASSGNQYEGADTRRGSGKDLQAGLGGYESGTGIDSGRGAVERRGPQGIDELREPGAGGSSVRESQGGSSGAGIGGTPSVSSGPNIRARSASTFLGPFSNPQLGPLPARPSEFRFSPVGERAYQNFEVGTNAGADYRARRFGVDPANGEIPPAWVATTDLFRNASMGNALVRGEVASRAGNKLGAYWYNNLLSGPAGAMTDVISNAMSIPMLMARTTVASGVETALRVPNAQRTATPEMVLGMGSAMVSGGYHGIKDFIHAFANGIEPIRGEQPRGMVNGKLGMVFEPISRVRVAADAMVFHMAEEMAVHGLAYREAAKEGHRLGTPAFAARVSQIVSDVAKELANGTPGTTPSSNLTPVGQFTAGMAGEATRMAKEAVFQEKAPHLIGGLSEARGIDAGVLNALVPFYRTIATIAYRGVDMTPGVGALMLATDLMRGGVFGSGPYADTGSGQGLMTRSPSDRTYLPATQRIGNQILGLGIATMGSMLVLMGKMTDAGPDDEKERKAMMDDGWRPFCWVTTDANGKKHYTSFITILGPAAFPLVFGATWAGNSQRKQETPDYNSLGAFTMAMRDFVFTQSGLKAYDDALNALGGDKRVKGVELAIAKFTSGLVPSVGLLRAINSATDPVLRTPSGMLFKWFEEGSSFNELSSFMAETAMAGIPGLSQYVPEKRNDIGDIQARPQGQSGYRAFLPLQGTEDKTDSYYRYYDSTSNLQDAKTSKAITAWEDYLAGKGPEPKQNIVEMAIVGKALKSRIFTLYKQEEDRRKSDIEMGYKARIPQAFGS